jgi:hypothetical protein
MAFPIFDKVGGTDKALDLIEASLGKRPTKFVQDKWRYKRALPAKLFMPLAEECMRHGIAFSAFDFDWREEVQS